MRTIGCARLFVASACGLAVAGLAGSAAELGLVEAARTQDWRTVRALVDRKVDVNIRSEDGSTALLWAAHWNDVAAATRLIRGGANPNIANDLKMTPLSAACTNGSGALVGALVEAGANVHARIATGETPLMTCAGTGSVAGVARLLAAGADVNASEPTQGQTALMWAAAEQHADVLRTLIKAGASVGAHSRKGFTALHFSARTGDIEGARVLLDAGVDLNARSTADSPEPGRGAAYQAGLSAGSTPLLVATVRGQVPFALFLLDRGADPDAGDAGLTPLHWAVATWEGGVSNPVYGFSDAMSGIVERAAKLRLVRALLAHGADPNARMARRPGFAGGYDDAAGATPFLLAAGSVDLEMMRVLLAAGADPTLVSDTKTNAVMAATGLNRLVGESPVTEAQVLDVVRFLFELGADGRGATTNGENALFGAAYRGWNRVLALLIEKGADVNAVTKAGVTPWLAASGLGDRLGGVLYNTEGAALLLKHGADPALGKPCQAQIKCR